MGWRIFYCSKNPNSLGLQCPYQFFLRTPQCSSTENVKNKTAVKKFLSNQTPPLSDTHTLGELKQGSAQAVSAQPGRRNSDLLYLHLLSQKTHHFCLVKVKFYAEIKVNTSELQCLCPPGQQHPDPALTRPKSVQICTERVPQGPGTLTAESQIPRDSGKPPVLPSRSNHPGQHAGGGGVFQDYS